MKNKSQQWKIIKNNCYTESCKIDAFGINSVRVIKNLKNNYYDNIQSKKLSNS